MVRANKGLAFLTCLMMFSAIPQGRAADATLGENNKRASFIASRLERDHRDKQDLADDVTLGALVTGGNGIYTVYVRTTGSCGVWTARTGPLHPAGPNLNVLFGNGSPNSSYTTLRSYSSGIDYATHTTIGGCTGLCTIAGNPSVTPIMNGATTVGYRLDWTFADGGNTLAFAQEVVVEGPVDGSETVDNTVIRETHFVANLGPGSFSYGLRKMWDWQIGPDDGPSFGDCDMPTDACDRSMNLTADGSRNGMYPQSYVINNSPATASCPGGLVPNEPAGCGGNPLYLVAGTVRPPSNLVPSPDAPELLQFNRWSSLYSTTCWEPTLTDNAPCVGGDTAVAYFYGRTAGSALSLGSGQQESFTQYIVAGTGTCPDIVTPGACCDDSTGTCTIEIESVCSFRYGGDGSDCTTIDPPCGGCPCDGDLTNNGGVVNLDDLIFFAGMCPCGSTNLAVCDINCDGVVDDGDLADLLCQFAVGHVDPTCCSAPHGACCNAMPNNHCIRATGPVCNSTQIQGTYQGDGTSCPPSPGDCDADGTPDYCQPDCDCDGLPDACEPDCQPNGIPDDCEPPSATCDGDVNNNGSINQADLILVEACVQCTSSDPACDVNCDGVINVLDVGDVFCLQLLPPEGCCDPPHGGCVSSNVPQGCVVASEALCEAVGGAYQGDGMPCVPTARDCNADGIGNGCQPQECVTDTDCIDYLDPPFNTMPNVCTCDRCRCFTCFHQPVEWGDATCDCSSHDVSDLLRIIADFQDGNTVSQASGTDIAVPCSGDLRIDLDDILGCLTGFSGMNPCLQFCAGSCVRGACCNGINCTLTSSANCPVGSYKGDGSLCPPDDPNVTCP